MLSGRSPCPNAGVGPVFSRADLPLTRRSRQRFVPSQGTASRPLFRRRSAIRVARRTVNGPALGHFDLAVANKPARARVADGEAIKFMRKAVGPPAVTLVELLDTSPETVSRWERGVSHIDRAASPSWRGSS
jgi:hypothetical protein